MPLAFPFIVGCDLAGTVEWVGSGVKRFKPGDRVWGSNQGMLGRQGTFAQLAAVDEHWLYALPAGVADETAAATALVGLTAHLGLVRDCRLTKGETIFVNGGSGGVGSMVVQMSKALGARVIATAGSSEGVEICRRLGADLAIDYKGEDVAARVREFAPQGVNVWWETTREPDFDRVVGLLAERGRMVLMAGRDARPQFPVGPFYVKGCAARFRDVQSQPRGAAGRGRRHQPLAGRRSAAGAYPARFPLAQAAEAHRLQEANTLHKAGTLCGKIVLTP